MTLVCGPPPGHPCDIGRPNLAPVDPSYPHSFPTRACDQASVVVAVTPGNRSLNQL